MILSLMLHRPVEFDQAPLQWLHEFLDGASGRKSAPAVQIFPVDE